MEEKKSVIVESVRKLLALDLPESEIFENLRDVGLGQEQARDILREAKGEPVPEQEKEEIQNESGDIMRDVAEKLEETKREGGQLEEIKAVKAVHAKNESTLSKLWEKGILTTINQRLAEMKSLKKDIDRAIAEKTRSIADAEIKKMQALLESKTTLLSESLNSKLEDKEHEIEDTLEIKIGQLKDLNKQFDEKIRSIRESERKQELMVQNLQRTEEELRKLKNELISEMNSELIKAKSESQDFLDEAKRKLEELDERVNRTLELEQEVIDGIMEDAKTKIDAMGKENRQKMEERIQQEMEKLEMLREEVAPEKIQEKVQELEGLRDEIKQDALGEIEGSIADKIKAYMRPMDVKMNELKMLEDDLVKTNTKMQELKNIQSEVIAKMKADVEGSRQDIREFMGKGEKKMGELEKSITEALALQSQLSMEFEESPANIQKLKEISFSVQELQDLKKELQGMKADLKMKIDTMKIAGGPIKGLDEVADALRERYDEMVEQKFRNKEQEFNDRIEQRAREMGHLKEELEGEIKKELDFDQMKHQQEELELFKEQFINVIDRNIDKFNEKIKKFNETTKAMEEHFKVRLESIDQKIGELDRFEKAFAKEMGMALEKITEE